MTTTLDRLLPSYNHRESHSRYIAASPADVWHGLQQVSWAELALARPLLALRALPARLTGSRPPWRQPGPIVANLPIANLPIALLAEEHGRELVFAGALRPWRRGDRPPPRLDRDRFLRFGDPGWVKVAMDIRLARERAGTRLTTETRIHATDRRARRVFAAYWLLIRPGSGLVRRELLRAIARRAEKRNAAGGTPARARV
jgi:hypothetical protein